MCSYCKLCHALQARARRATIKLRKFVLFRTILIPKTLNISSPCTFKWVNKTAFDSNKYFFKHSFHACSPGDWVGPQDPKECRWGRQQLQGTKCVPPNDYCALPSAVSHIQIRNSWAETHSNNPNSIRFLLKLGQAWMAFAYNPNTRKVVFQASCSSLEAKNHPREMSIGYISVELCWSSLKTKRSRRRLPGPGLRSLRSSSPVTPACTRHITGARAKTEVTFHISPRKI